MKTLRKLLPGSHVRCDSLSHLVKGVDGLLTDESSAWPSMRPALDARVRGRGIMIAMIRSRASASSSRAQLLLVALFQGVSALAFLTVAFERQAAALPPPGRVTGTPWDLYRELLAGKMPALERCSVLAKKQGRFGDVTAHFDWRAKRRLSVETTRSLGEDVRRCALEELEPFAEKVYDLLGKGADFQASWELGTIRPLFDAGDHVFRSWTEAVRAPAGTPGKRAKERALARILPPDVTVADGCLVLAPAAKFAFSAAVGQWIRAISTPVHASFWGGRLTGVADVDVASLSVVAAPSPALLVHIEDLDADTETDPRTSHYSPRIPRPSKNVLCLRPFDDQLAGLVKKAVEAAGRCWRSGPIQSLTAPRFSFPAGRAYTRVASSLSGPACALDGTGEVTCCGPTTTTLSGRYLELDVTNDRVCTLSTAGQASCVDLRDGHTVQSLPGKFTHISASAGGICGISDAAKIVCQGKDSEVGNPPQGKFREVDAGALCAIDLSGRLVCWSSGRSEKIEKGPWRQVTSSKSEPGKGCALDVVGHAWCWSSGRPAAIAPAAASVEVSKIRMGLGNACGIGARCGIQCWEGSTPSGVAATCANDLALGRPSCVVSKSGQIDCWGADLWGDDAPPQERR